MRKESVVLCVVIVVALIALLRSTCLPVDVVSAPDVGDPVACLMDAMWRVEASGDPDPPNGANGEIGPYQITRAYWYDSGVPGRYEDCSGVDYSRRVMRAYWRRYVPGALARGDLEVLARTHNGGPHGATRAVTLPYWKKVKEVLGEGH